MYAPRIPVADAFLKEVWCLPDYSVPGATEPQDRGPCLNWSSSICRACCSGRGPCTTLVPALDPGQHYLSEMGLTVCSTPLVLSSAHGVPNQHCPATEFGATSFQELSLFVHAHKFGKTYRKPLGGMWTLLMCCGCV